MQFKVFLFSFILCQYWANAARILGLIPIKAKSHFYFNEALLKSLADAGHHVTLINPYSANNDVENFTLIQIPAEETEEKNPFNAVALKKANTINIFLHVFDVNEKECERVLKMPIIQNLLKSPKNRFDLVFLEQFYMYECLLPIAEKLEVPIISTFSSESLSVIDFYHGNPRNPSVHPFETTGFGLKMTFFQRLQNVYYYLVDVYLREIVIRAKLERFYDKHFPTFDLEKCRKISLTFLNTNPSFVPRPMVPSIISVGGIHVEMATEQQLPKDIKKFIEEAPHGVILFSLGSIISGPALTPELRAAFREAFAQIPQRVIWKFDEIIPDLSDNVLMAKWVPQREILAHPNVVAFMSHCGSLSSFEAIYNAKPMILIPIFADQPFKAARLAEFGVGLLLNIESFTADDLVKLIKEITNNPKYTENMLRLSNAVKDVPIAPSESIVFWTEYVLRHNGAKHLRTVGADMPFYQYLLLDVIALLVSIFIVSISLLIYLCKKIYRIIAPSKVKGKMASKKKKQ